MNEKTGLEFSTEQELETKLAKITNSKAIQQYEKEKSDCDAARESLNFLQEYDAGQVPTDKVPKAALDTAAKNLRKNKKRFERIIKDFEEKDNLKKKLECLKESLPKYKQEYQEQYEPKNTNTISYVALAGKNTLRIYVPLNGTLLETKLGKHLDEHLKDIGLSAETAETASNFRIYSCKTEKPEDLLDALLLSQEAYDFAKAGIKLSLFSIGIKDSYGEKDKGIHYLRLTGWSRKEMARVWGSDSLRTTLLRKGRHAKKKPEAEQCRNQLDKARNLLEAGKSKDEVCNETGLSKRQVHCVLTGIRRKNATAHTQGTGPKTDS